MGEWSRRAVLAAAAAGLGALAGCVEQAADGDTPARSSPSPRQTTDRTMPGPGRDTDDDAGDDPGRADGTEDGTTIDVEAATESHQVGRALSGPAWDRETTVGACRLLRGADEQPALFEDADEATRSFLAATDFDRAVVLYLESVGPTSCHDELAVTALRLDTDRAALVGEAAVRDTSEPMVACRDVITYPATLVRVPVDAPVREAALRVTDGMGRTGVVRSREDPANGSASRWRLDTGGPGSHASDVGSGPDPATDTDTDTDTDTNTEPDAGPGPDRGLDRD